MPYLPSPMCASGVLVAYMASAASLADRDHPSVGQITSSSRMPRWHSRCLHSRHSPHSQLGLRGIHISFNRASREARRIQHIIRLSDMALAFWKHRLRAADSLARRLSLHGASLPTWSAGRRRCLRVVRTARRRIPRTGRSSPAAPQKVTSPPQPWRNHHLRRPSVCRSPAPTCHRSYSHRPSLRPACQ